MKKLTPRESMIYSFLHRDLVVELGLTFHTLGLSQKYYDVLSYRHYTYLVNTQTETSEKQNKMK